MSTQVVTKAEISAEERALLVGDLKALSQEQRSNLYMKVCNSLGLNPLTQPFQYLELNGKLQFYASRNCTDQLRQIHNISLKISGRDRVGDTYIVTAQATTPQGRVDESTGAITIGHLKGDALANGLMRCETKAKRRVTLSICGLSLLDETELDTVREARHVPMEPIKSTPQIRSTTPPPQAMSHDPPPSETGDPGPWEKDPPPMPPHRGPKIEEPDFSGGYETYTIPFGKYSGKRLDQIGVHLAGQYADWLRFNSQKSGKELSDGAMQFCEMFREWQMAINKTPEVPPEFNIEDSIPF